MVKAITLFLTLVTTPVFASVNLQVDIPWDFEQIEADRKLLKAADQSLFNLEYKEVIATEGQFYIFWTLQVLDVYSTYRGLKYSCVKEANPLIGDRPGVPRLVTHKTLFLHPIWMLRNEDVIYKTDMNFLNGQGTIVVINNYRIWNRAHKKCRRL